MGCGGNGIWGGGGVGGVWVLGGVGLALGGLEGKWEGSVQGKRGGLESIGADHGGDQKIQRM